MAGKRKYIFAQESFYLQGILNDINEQDTSFLDCKHKHMMKSGAPHDKLGVLYSMVSQAELILMVITLWFLVSSQFFRDGMGPFNACSPQIRTSLERKRNSFIAQNKLIILPVISESEVGHFR